MSLLKTSAWNGIAVSVRMATAVVLNKVLAIYVGPSGYATIGQFQNFSTIAAGFSAGAITAGVTKHTAEDAQDTERQYELWRTALVIVTLLSLVVGLFLLLFREYLSLTLLHDRSFSSVFIWFAIALLLISLNSVILAIMNGKKDLRRYIISNLAGSLISLACTAFLAWYWGLYGALVALSVYQGFVFFVSLYQIMHAPWFDYRLLLGRLNIRPFQQLATFAIMALTTTIVGPVSQILVRSHLSSTFGLVEAGIWDAMWKISTLYLALVTSSLSFYYLPRIAEINTASMLRSEIVSTARVVMPIVAASAVVMYFSKEVLIALLFTNEFMMMRELFLWQLTGDVIKIASWLLAYIMIGKAMAKLFVLTEVLFGVLFWILTVALVNPFGFEGVAIAHLVNYLMYFLTMYIFVFRPLSGAGSIKQVS